MAADPRNKHSNCCKPNTPSCMYSNRTLPPCCRPPQANTIFVAAVPQAKTPLLINPNVTLWLLYGGGGSGMVVRSDGGSGLAATVERVTAAADVTVGVVCGVRWCGRWGGSGWWWCYAWGRRVMTSGMKDRVDRSKRSIFGFAGKSPTEKFSGGGGVVAVVAGGRRWGESIIKVCVCVCIKMKMR
nr:hypothetical protein [Tanacetum cinerariifolium]